MTAKVGGVNDWVLEKAIEPAIKGISRVVRERIIRIVHLVMNNPGIKNIELQKELGVSERTITSDIKRLKGYIIYEGSKKGGGYILVKSFEKELKN